MSRLAKLWRSIYSDRARSRSGPGPPSQAAVTAVRFAGTGIWTEALPEDEGRLLLSARKRRRILLDESSRRRKRPGLLWMGRGPDGMVGVGAASTEAVGRGRADWAAEREGLGSDDSIWSSVEGCSSAEKRRVVRML